MRLILVRAENLAANLLDLSCKVLIRAAKCLHKHQHCNAGYEWTASDSNVSQGSHKANDGARDLRAREKKKKNKKEDSSIPTPPTRSLGSSLTIVNCTAPERSNTSLPEKHQNRYPPELKETYRKAQVYMAATKAKKKIKSEGSSKLLSVKATAPFPPSLPRDPPQDISAGNHMMTPSQRQLSSAKKGLESGERNVTILKNIAKHYERGIQPSTDAYRLATQVMGPSVSVSRSSRVDAKLGHLHYQQRIKELEERHVVVNERWQNYSRAKTSLVKAQATSQSVIRQGEYSAGFWLKPKKLKEKNLKKSSQKLSNARKEEAFMVQLGSYISEPFFLFCIPL